jgi:hypothetical protein
MARQNGKGTLLDSGTPSPNPWDLSLSRQNGCFTLKELARRIRLRRDATRAPMQRPEWQGAAKSAAPNSNPRPRRALAYCGQKMVLTMGSTLPGPIRPRLLCRFDRQIALQIGGPVPVRPPLKPAMRHRRPRGRCRSLQRRRLTVEYHQYSADAGHPFRSNRKKSGWGVFYVFGLAHSRSPQSSFCERTTNPLPRRDSRNQDCLLTGYVVAV